MSHTKDDAEQSLLALNVCLLPPGSIQRAAVATSANVCVSSMGTPLEYILTGEGSSSAACPAGRGLPHATLTQLFVLPTDVSALVAAMRGAKACTFAAAEAPTVSFLEGIAPGPVFAHHEGLEVRLPSLAIATRAAGEGAPSFIVLLHNAVTAAASPFRTREPRQGGSACFASTWPGNSASCEWVARYDVNSSGAERYFPHITLGASMDDGGLSAAQMIAMPDSLAAEWTVAVCRMGNFCSCNEVIAIV
jgi:hypothetical protein